MTIATILELRDIGQNFGGFRALDEINLSVLHGLILGLIGPNGSGKTTLFNIVTGYIEPTQGRVFFTGRDLENMPTADRSRLGLVRTFQTPKIFDGMTVLENVMVGANKDNPTSFIGDLPRTPRSWAQFRNMQTRAEAICHEFGLARLIDIFGSKLTAGQRRTVELARAVAGSPRLLLLDEPSSGLNVEETDNLRNAIRSLKAKGISTVLVSHDMDLMDVADAVSVLYMGRIIAEGTMHEVRDNERVRQVYLGSGQC